MQPLEQMQAIVSSKGSALMQTDIDEIDYLTLQLNPNDAYALRAMIDEAISLIVNDPLYTGDIAPAE